jgi:hypothetical protein
MELRELIRILSSFRPESNVFINDSFTFSIEQPIPSRLDINTTTPNTCPNEEKEETLFDE